jgi:hypothetical protein
MKKKLLASILAVFSISVFAIDESPEKEVQDQKFEVCTTVATIFEDVALMREKGMEPTLAVKNEVDAYPKVPGKLIMGIATSVYFDDAFKGLYGSDLYFKILYACMNPEPASDQ